MVAASGGIARAVLQLPLLVAVVALLGLTGAFPSPSAQADACGDRMVSPQVAPDCYLLYQLRQQGIVYSEPQAAISRARATCDLLSTYDLVRVLQAFMRSNSGFNQGQAADFVAISSAAYCPGLA